MLNSPEEREEVLKGPCREAILPGQLYRDRLQRRNRPDTGEDRTSQRLRRSQIRTGGQRQIEAKQSSSGEAQRSQTGSVMVERSVSQSI